MKIKPLKREEIPLVLGIRNDERTRHRLDDDSAFTERQGYDWFDSKKPEWFSIYSDDQFVGYIRTDKKDGICVGCDIHPDHRNKGLGRHALNWIICQSISQNINNIWLQVFQDNITALNLYQKLGFRTTEYLTTRGKPALKMSLNVKKQDIDILTILNKPHAHQYLNFLQTSMQKLSAGYLTIRLNILENYTNYNAGSSSHGEGIQLLAKNAATKNFIVCDYDTAILCRNWDKILSFLLDQFPATGTEYPPAYGKYTNFPTLFFSAWNTQIWQELDPDLNYKATYDPSLLNYQNLKNPDVGNALPTYYKKYRSYAWEQQTHELETYFVYDLPFVTHLGRGTHREFSTHPRAISWVNTVNEIIEKC